MPRNDAIAFTNGVVDEGYYVTDGELHHSRHVLVHDGAPSKPVFNVAEDNDMVCVRVNQLRDESFDCELTFRHVNRTDIGGGYE